MSKPETTFYGSVHRHLPRELYCMKNHNPYVGGVPDVWYSGNLGDLWVEYKFIIVPKRDTTVIDLVGGRKPDISALQQEWLRARHREGRKVAVVVGCKDGGVFFDGVSWDMAYSTAAFRSWLIPRKGLAEMIVSKVHHEPHPPLHNGPRDAGKLPDHLDNGPVLLSAREVKTRANSRPPRTTASV